MKTQKLRAEDLMNAFKDPSIKGIFQILVGVKAFVYYHILILKYNSG